MTTATATRYLIATTTSGWYLNADDLDGKRVRKTDTDEIIGNVADAGDTPIAAYVQLMKLRAQGEDEPADEAPAQTSKAAQNAAKADQPVTVSETGKRLIGKTVTIKCKWDGCKVERVIKPQDEFQVKYCVTHQKEHRKVVRRDKQRAKTAARKTAAAAQSAA